MQGFPQQNIKNVAVGILGMQNIDVMFLLFNADKFLFVCVKSWT